ncbi:MAG: RNA polymerase sigma factor [Sarcina sp.]
MSQTKEEILQEVYTETYEDILKFVISRCNNIEDSKDIIQNTYFNFYKALGKRKIENYNKYLFKIARHEIYKTYGLLKLIKNTVPIFSLTTTEIDFNNDSSLIVDNDFDVSLLCDDIYSYLRNKNPLTFKIFTLYFKCDMKIKDISKTLNISESTVKNRLYRTVKELKINFNI